MLQGHFTFLLIQYSCLLRIYNEVRNVFNRAKSILMKIKCNMKILKVFVFKFSC